jgi:hypothetical protein
MRIPGSDGEAYDVYSESTQARGPIDALGIMLCHDAFTLGTCIWKFFLYQERVCVWRGRPDVISGLSLSVVGFSWAANYTRHCSQMMTLWNRM